MVRQNNNNQTELATLGGGCFWCIETIYLRVKGINKVISGYTGGQTINPTYEEVCSGNTGHAEVVQIEYDPKEISYSNILDIFFDIHDPTTLNKQGPDTGTQYRSEIFYHNDNQKSIANDKIKMLTENQIFDAPIVTEISKINVFYNGEDYHQDYFANNPMNPYCVYIINPKLQKFLLQNQPK